MAFDSEKSLEQRLDALQARLDVRELLDRYAVSYTTRNWQGVEECYVPEAVFHELPPVELMQKTRQEIIDIGKMYMDSMKDVVMMIHSCLITVDGTTASARTILHESGRTNNDEPVEMYGHYHDEIVFRDGRWCFLKRVFQPLHWVFPESFQALIGEKLVEQLS
jgi:hypothetical protein